ncbi:transmembrane and coiled-coil domains-containing protein 7, partial [Kappamyces sp. JEL0680]
PTHSITDSALKSKWFEKISVLLLASPPPPIDIKSFFDSICLQLVTILTTGSDFQASIASHVFIAFLVHRPKLAKDLLLDPFLDPLLKFTAFDSYVRSDAAENRDVEGNCIVVDEEAIQNTLVGLEHLLVGNEPTPSLIDGLAALLFPLFVIYQTIRQGASAQTKAVEKILLSLLTLVPIPVSRSLLDVCVQSIERNSLYVKLGANGGVVFSIDPSHHDFRNVVDPAAFVALLNGTSDPQTTGDVFVHLVEARLALKNNTEDELDEQIMVLYSALILEMLDQHGDALLKNTKQMLAFCKASLVQGAGEDTESVHLGLTLLTQL